MRRWVLVLALLACAPPGTAGPTEWKCDVIHRTKGEPYTGLIIDEDRDKVTIRCIIRKRGAPTVVYREVIMRADIRRIAAISEKERQELAQRLDALKREREALADHLRSLDPKEKGKDEAADLERMPWPPDEKREALGYNSKHFRLIADTSPELARLASIHLEQVYTAYARYLPPRIKGERTTILLTRSLADYRGIAKARGLEIFNPAFYDPQKNQVVCGSDLEKLCDDLKKVREDHAKLRASIKERRAELAKAYRDIKKVPDEFLEPLAKAEKRMQAADAKNDSAFARVRQRLFMRLYHEAFHAYLGNFVYPPKDNAVPHWLNEGLAQVFETAIVEVGELRVGRADIHRLEAVKDAIKAKKLLPLADLLKATPRQFLVEHAKELDVSDRHYLASWALAFHLTFERQLLGTKKLDEYVAALKREADPLTAFAELVGESVEEFEAKHLEYLGKLKSDGTTGGK